MSFNHGSLYGYLESRRLEVVGLFVKDYLHLGWEESINDGGFGYPVTWKELNSRYFCAIPECE